MISRIESAGLDGPKTLILDNAQKVKLSKAMKAFLDERGTDTTTILFAVVRSEKLPAGWSQVGEKGEVSEAKKFKPWMVDDITRWIENEASTHNVKLGPEVASTLLRWVDVDLYRLANEVRKLATFVGPNGTVTKQHLDLVTSKTPGATQFQVAEAAGAKKPQVSIYTFSIIY